MSVGIVSLWHNAVELLPEWERLLSPGGWDEAILVDNGSSPLSQAIYDAEAGLHGFDVLHMAENNVNAGWNAGMNALTTDVRICMANDLVMIDPTWIFEATRYMMPGVLMGPYLMRFATDTPGESVLYLDGSMIVYHALDWQALGGLDEGYLHPGYVSDVDICWRAQQMGFLLRACPKAVLHLGNYSTGVPKGGIHPTWPANRARFLARMAGGDMCLDY